ncbi:hypothetical protein U1Q18_007330 [Sarracenia purpurea var. burkii]
MDCLGLLIQNESPFVQPNKPRQQPESQLISGFLQPIPDLTPVIPSVEETSVIDPTVTPYESSIIFFYKTWDRYGAFSNFSPHAIRMTDESGNYVTWPSVEHYYQAHKFVGVDNPAARNCVENIRSAKSPEEAARMGRIMQRQNPDLDWQPQHGLLLPSSIWLGNPLFGAIYSEYWGKFIMLDDVAAILRKILVVYYCCCCNLRIVLAVYCAVANVFGCFFAVAALLRLILVVFLMLLLQFEDDFGCFAVAVAFLRMSLAAFDVVAAEFWRFSLSIVTAEIASLLFAVSWSLC